MHIKYSLACILLTFFSIVVAHTDTHALVNDVAAMQILSPQSYTPVSRMVYPTAFPVRIEARFKNAGSSTQSDVEVGYTVADSSGAVVFTSSGIIRGSWVPGELRDLMVKDFVPLRPGTYYVRIFTRLAGDEDPSNDSLERGSGPGRPFLVRYLHELGSVPSASGVTPAVGATFPAGQPIPIRMAFVNNGFIDATNVPARVSIWKGVPYYGGSLIYSRSLTVPVVPGNDTALGEAILIQFPDLAPPSPGSYWIEAAIRSTEDFIYSNDSLRWEFHVSPGSSDVPHAEQSNHFNPEHDANGALALWPNPAHGTTALVDLRVPASTIARLDLHDASGRLMKSLVGEEVMREKSVRLDLSDLASGLYLIRVVTMDGTERTETLVVAR